jgi:hypothetical protein
MLSIIIKTIKKTPSLNQPFVFFQSTCRTWPSHPKTLFSPSPAMADEDMFSGFDMEDEEANGTAPVFDAVKVAEFARHGVTEEEVSWWRLLLLRPP